MDPYGNIREYMANILWLIYGDYMAKMWKTHGFNGKVIYEQSIYSLHRMAMTMIIREYR